ncbi:MAG: hypothetical protein N4A70_04420 [Pelagimonas sp.]|jgi:hypothetical protein|nr:hypothetical protein [Pelagimonas sp.]
MPGTDDFFVTRLFSLCERLMLTQNLSLDVSTDFEASQRRMTAMQKDSFTPMLCSRFHDFSKDDAFYMFLRKGSKDIAGVAARLDNLHSETLSDYWTRSYARLYGQERERISHLHAPAAISEIRGRVVYLGEFYFTPSARGSRNLLRLFTNSLFSYCHLHWKPDWQYAFIRKKHIDRGYAGVYGFTRQIPGAQTWLAPPEGRSSQEYLVALPHSELIHSARYYVTNPELFLGEDTLSKVEKLST